MQTQVTFRHFKAQQPDLHDAAMTAADGFEKYMEGILSTEVIFTNDVDKTVEFFVKIKGDTIVAKEATKDFHRSLTDANDKIVRQLIKWKTKHTAK
ncbi:MAG: HPF/RaiA family ribosome-associated protein [Candidatus Kapabacteria bacterium]|nr:HPF/RaiA family ribosome-associated protein [Candidatus Kapabacteria bacterium]